MSPATGTDRDLLRDAGRLRELYVERNMSQRQIGDLAGVSRATVVRYLREHGVARAGYEPPEVGAAWPAALKDVDWLTERIGSGSTLRALADELGTSRATVGRAARHHGIRVPMGPPRSARSTRGEGAAAPRPPSGRRRGAGSRSHWLLGRRDWLDRRMTVDGATAQELATQLGVGRSTVVAALAAFGIEPVRREDVWRPTFERTGASA